MTVGLPGVGLGGIFYLLSALLMPLFELARTVRGRSSPGRWRVVGTQWTLAAGIVTALWGTGWALGQVVPQPAALVAAGASAATGHNVLRVATLGLSLGTLIVVLLGVEIARLILASPGRPLRSRPAATAALGSDSTPVRPIARTNDPRRSGAPLRRKSIGRSPEAE